MSAEVTGDVFYLDMESRQKFVLAVLADNASDNGLCWPSQELIALKTSTSERHCRSMLHNLELAGWLIVVKRGDGRGNVTQYRLNVARIRAEAARRREAIRRDKEERAAAFGVAKGERPAAFRMTKEEQPTSFPGERGQPVPPNENRKAESHALKEESCAAKAESCALKEEHHSGRTVIEPSIEPSEEPGGTGSAAEPRPPRHDEFTQGYDSLEEIPGVQRESVEAYRLTRRMLVAGVSPEDFRLAASALASKWPGPKSRPYRNPWLTVYNWSLRDLEHRLKDRRGGRIRDGPATARPSNGESGRHPEEDHERKQREANEWAERQRLARAQHRGPAGLSQL